MKSRFLSLLLILLTTNLFAQIGGKNTFAILGFNPSVRSLAMGGELISILDDDVGMAANNPALLNNKMHHKISFSFVDYFADINAVAVNYAAKSEKLGMLFFGVKALNYGEFIQTDETGRLLGEFTANEQVLTSGISKQLNNKLTIGVNLNFINSKLEQYSSIGLSSNFALSYFNDEQKLCIAFLAQDFGRQLKSYINKK